MLTDAPLLFVGHVTVLLGTTFPHLFLLTYGYLKPQKCTVSYTPRIFGFKVNLRYRPCAVFPTLNFSYLILTLLSVVILRFVIRQSWPRQRRKRTQKELCEVGLARNPMIFLVNAMKGLLVLCPRLDLATHSAWGMQKVDLIDE